MSFVESDEGNGVLCRIFGQGEFQSSAFLTLETLCNTSKGRMSPLTTTIFVSRSTLYDLTPVAKHKKKAIIRNRNQSFVQCT